MASNDLVTNCTLILSTKLTKGDVSYPGTVGAGFQACPMMAQASHVFLPLERGGNMTLSILLLHVSQLFSST